MSSTLPNDDVTPTAAEGGEFAGADAEQRAVDAPAGAGVRVDWLTFDCRDEDRVARFWQALLGLEPPARRGPYLFARGPSGLGFGFQHVSEEKTTKNRVHVDLRVDDLDATHERVLALGGSDLPAYAEGGFLVMADPEGNEFCLIPTEGAHLDENGRAHYRH